MYNRCYNMSKFEQKLNESDFTEAKNLINNGASVNQKFANNYRPLHVAISNTKASNVDIYDMCEFLINKGALTYVNTCYHQTPLHLICKNGISDFDDNFDLVKLLIKHGANIEYDDGFYGSSLMIGFQSKNPEVFAYFLELLKEKNIVSDYIQVAFCVSMQHNTDEAIFRKMLSMGAKVDAPIYFDDPYYPFENACSSKNIEAVKFLLDNGIHIDNFNGDNPLHIMIRTGFSEGAIYVIEKGANIEVLNSYKNTPLHSACYNELEDVALLLISKGARLDVCGMYNSISLHLACMKGLTKVIKVMIEHGANVHHQDNHGRTPLELLNKDNI